MFADPPYETADAEIETLVSRLGGAGMARARRVVRRSSARPGAELNLAGRALEAGWERTFGDTLVVFVEASDSPT